MNYNKDTTRLSVLVVTILLVGSSFAFLPAFASTGGARTGAVKSISSPTANGAPPTVVGTPDVIQGVAPIAFSVKVTNPSTNAYAITSITVLAPADWAFAGSNTCGPVGSGLATPGVTSATAVQCTAGATSGLPPGFSATLVLGTLAWTGAAPVATEPPNQGTFTTLVIDSSGAASYAGGSFTEWNIFTTTVAVAVSPVTTTFTAGGSALTVTATLSSGQAGVPIVWSFSNAAYPTSGYTATLSPTSGVTTASGTSTTFTPSNHAPDATTVVATIGTSATTAATGTITTGAGAPTKVSFYFTVSSVTYPARLSYNPTPDQYNTIC